MLDRSLPLLRISCLILAGVLFLQITRLIFHHDPLAGVHIPSALAAASSSRRNPRALATNDPPTHSLAGGALASGQAAALPPAWQQRVDRITQSEILGPVMHPPPMALLGIAGADAFFRAPNGQTGLLRAGEELGGVKLLTVGTNRILIEQDGQKKELTIFSGFGSETLVPREKENPQ